MGTLASTSVAKAPHPVDKCLAFPTNTKKGGLARTGQKLPVEPGVVALPQLDHLAREPEPRPLDGGHDLGCPGELGLDLLPSMEIMGNPGVDAFPSL